MPAGRQALTVLAAVAALIALGGSLGPGRCRATEAEPALTGPAGPAQVAPLRMLYVDGTDGDDARDGLTEATAWQTIGRASEAVMPGDAVSIRAGVYANQCIVPARSGTPGAPITYTIRGDGPVVVEGATPCAVFLQGKSYIRIQGITFRRCQAMLHILEGSHHNEISHCTFDQSVLMADGRMEWGGSRVWQSSYNWIHHCTFSRWGMVTRRGQDHGACLDIGYWRYDAASYNLVENNLLFYGGHHVLGFSGNHNVFRNNYVHNERWMDDPRRPGIKMGNRCLIGEGGHLNLIEGNRLAFAGVPPDDNGAFGAELSSSGNMLRRNAFYCNGNAGLGLHSKYFAAAMRNYVYANTFYRNGLDEAIETIHKGGISIQNYRGAMPEGNVIKNNIFSANAKGKCYGIGSNVRRDAQAFAGNYEEVGDPLFVDVRSRLDPFVPTLPDLHLRPGSPCIDAAAWLTTVTSPSGSGRSFTVEDASYFMDGWGIVEGDLIQLQGGAQRARITRVDYEANAIEVDADLTWAPGTGVSLAYEGRGPDVGAYESANTR
jgi:hypothetical protein